MSVLTLVLMASGTYGTFVFNVTGAGVDLRAAAIAAGWNQVATVQATVAANLGSVESGVPALTVAGSFPGGMNLIINSGIYVAGAGGAGGAGGEVFSAEWGAVPIGGSAGGPGGLALALSPSGTNGPWTITNNGTIAGGGGGGGGGGAVVAGGYGFTGATGGRGAGYVTGDTTVNITAETSGPTSSDGGAFATAGYAGAAGSATGGAGGAAGAAVTGAASATWAVVGTRTGSVT